MTDLTEKNLEAALLNLTKTGKPIKIKPTTWFGNPAKTAQWYACPNCGKQSPLTLKWVDLTDNERINIAYKSNGNECVAVELTEAKLKEKNL